jgi:hypothetical protein
MAMAHTDAGKQPHASGIIACETNTKFKKAVINDANPTVYSCNLPRRKLPKIRVKFRSVSSFKTPALHATGLDNAVVEPESTRLLNGRTANILPFYYVFLFRLTPF